MIPGVNGNAVTGSIPQTRSQAGVDATPGGVERTPGEIPAGKPIDTAAIPAPTSALCQECIRNKYAMTQHAAELAGLRASEEHARTELTDMAMRLEAASGVTINARQAETILRLQKADETQRNDIWSLEQINAAQSAEIRELREMLRRAKVDVAVTPANEQPTAARPGTATNVLFNL